MAKDCFLKKYKGGSENDALPYMNTIIMDMRGGSTQIRVLNKDRIKVYLDSTQYSDWQPSGSLPGSWYINITGSGVLKIENFYDIETLNAYGGINYLRTNLLNLEKIINNCPLAKIGLSINDGFIVDITNIIKNKTTLELIGIDYSFFDLKEVIESQYGNRTKSLEVNVPFTGYVYLNGVKMSSNTKIIDFSNSTVTISENGTVIASYNGSTWTYNS